MKKRLQGLIVGILIGATITGGVVFATTGTKTIEVLYNNIKVYKDNVLCELKDANGAVIEPFIYNGTTYMPVRGTANLADMQVTWDGETKSVYLWDEQVPGDTYLLDSCPPYNTYYCTEYFSYQSFSMGGKKYANGLVFSDSVGYALFNLDSKYSTIECTIGHTGWEDYDKTVSFIVDGKTIKTIELEKQCLPKKVSIPVKYGLQLKIKPSEMGKIGVGEIIVK